MTLKNKLEKNSSEVIAKMNMGWILKNLFWWYKTEGIIIYWLALGLVSGRV